MLEEACARFESLPDPLPWIRLANLLAALRLDCGADPSGLLARVRRRLDERPDFAAEPIGQEILATLRFLEARTAARAGKKEEALRLLREAIPTFDRVENLDDASAARLLMVHLGSPDGAGVAAKALADARKIRHECIQAEALAAIARLEALAGREAEARARLAESVEVARRVAGETDIIRALRARGEALEALGDRAAAAAANGEAAARADRIGARGLA
jgi:tetratricopeptide (TPR) repeat protein